MAENRAGKSRDWWERLEFISKIVGGVSVPIVGLALTYALQQQTQSSQQAQLYANITTGREKADSDVRSQMFSRLLDRYLLTRADRPETIEDYRDRVMFLDLLRSNFEEYFNARPLFGRLHDQIRERETRAAGGERPAWAALKHQLVEVARDTTSRQIARLVRSGHLTEDIVVPVRVSLDSEEPVSPRIALYPVRGLRGLNGIFKLSDDDWNGDGEPDPGSSRASSRNRYSITIRVKDVMESSAKVSVLLYRDVFDRDEFKADRSLPDLRPIEFEVSFFSTPYMDNTRLFDGSRFSVLYDGCIDRKAQGEVCRFPLSPSAEPMAQFKVVVFDEAFLSQRDRPYVDQILEKIGTSQGKSSGFPLGGPAPR